MGTNPARVLEEGIERVRRGESIEDYLAKYPEMRAGIEPLLNMAHTLSSLPRISPSEQFQEAARIRLMSRIRQPSVQKKAVKSGTGNNIFDTLAVLGQKIWHPVLNAKKVAIPVSLTLVVTLVLVFSGVLSIATPSPALAAKCTLSILSGTVEIQSPGEDRSQQGTDGETLVVGTRIRTAPDSHALLTFFEGSTIKLDPNTDVEIQRVEHTDEQNTTILVKQWLGKTWSRVIQMADPGSNYQIETPTATAIVRGTLFTTNVAETGYTTVATTKGLVSVVAQGEEVYLPANQQTQVEAGVVPSPPEILPAPGSELVITMDMPAVGSITDPTGSSTGILPGGESYNQIPGSQSTSPSEMVQLINIAEPVDGEYVIALRYSDEGVARFNIQGKSGSEVIFEYTGTWGAAQKSGWLIHFNLGVDDGSIVDGEINSVEPLGEETPEKGIPADLDEEDSVSGKPSKTEDVAPDGTTDDEGPAGDDEASGDEKKADDRGSRDEKGSAGDKDKEKDSPEDTRGIKSPEDGEEGGSEDTKSSGERTGDRDKDSPRDTGSDKDQKGDDKKGGPADDSSDESGKGDKEKGSPGDDRADKDQKDDKDKGNTGNNRADKDQKDDKENSNSGNTRDGKDPAGDMEAGDPTDDDDSTIEEILDVISDVLSDVQDEIDNLFDGDNDDDPEDSPGDTDKDEGSTDDKKEDKSKDNKGKKTGG
jgi:hypothetical protein